MYQTIKIPDDLIFHVYVPVEGRQYNAFFYLQSGIDNELRDNIIINDVQHFLYAEKPYGVRPWIQTTCLNPLSSDARGLFNRSMSKVRTVVEWSYGELKQQFTRDILSERSMCVMYLSLLLKCYVQCSSSSKHASTEVASDRTAFNAYLQNLTAMCGKCSNWKVKFKVKLTMK